MRTFHRALITGAVSVGALALASLLLAGTAHAAPVQYDEAVSGDLSPGPGAGTVFVLSAGVHTVRGTFGRQNGATDFDSFVFVFFSPLQLLSLNVTVQDAVGDITATDWELRTGSLIFAGSAVELLEIDPVPGMASATVPITAGTYHLAHRRIGSAGANPDRLADYVFTFELAPAAAVPVAGTAALAALGLPALLFGTRRKRR